MDGFYLQIHYSVNSMYVHVVRENIGVQIMCLKKVTVSILLFFLRENQFLQKLQSYQL